MLIFFIKLLSVCATLGEDPIIRFQSQSEGGIHPQGSPAGKLAHIVQKEIDNFCRLNPNFPVSLKSVCVQERERERLIISCSHHETLLNPELRC